MFEKLLFSNLPLAFITLWYLWNSKLTRMNIKSLGKEAFISSLGAMNMIIPMNVTTDCVRQITFFLLTYTMSSEKCNTSSVINFPSVWACFRRKNIESKTHWKTHFSLRKTTLLIWKGSLEGTLQLKHGDTWFSLWRTWFFRRHTQLRMDCI